MRLVALFVREGANIETRPHQPSGRFENSVMEAFLLEGARRRALGGKNEFGEIKYGGDAPKGASGGIPPKNARVQCIPKPDRLLDGLAFRRNSQDVIRHRWPSI